MTKKLQGTNWTIKVRKNGKTVIDTSTHSYRRFISILSLGTFPETIVEANEPIEIYIRANYGKHIDSNGDLVTFDNEGVYNSYKEATIASRAFAEISREWEEE